MTDERYKQMMEQLGAPNSQSVLNVLQCTANEAAQEARTKERERICAALTAADAFCVKNGYVLDSGDCLAIANGAWIRPVERIEVRDGYASKDSMIW